MKTRKTIVQLLMTWACLLVFTTSCSVENIVEDLLALECNSEERFDEVLKATSLYQQAINAYAQEQNTANCQALKASGDAYIEAIEIYRNCDPDNNSDFDNELDEAKAALADIDC